MPIPTAAERLGSVLAGRYRLDSILGEGGMGVVYAGRHELTGRSVAIKLLQPTLVSDAGVVARFFQEAKAAAALDHPNVVDVLDMGVDDGDVYLALEQLEGQPLSAILQERKAIEPAELLEILLPVIDALAAAHERGILHRDLKPDNIFVSRDLRGRRTPKVLDFGIAKLTEGDSSVKTKTGGLVGTPHYMSPEQAMARADIGPATDVWSMGVLLYECLSGERPFFAESIPALLMQICALDPMPLAQRKPSVPPALAQAVGRALQRELEARTRSMEELGASLVSAARESGITLSESVQSLFDGARAAQPATLSARPPIDDLANTVPRGTTPIPATAASTTPAARARTVVLTPAPDETPAPAATTAPKSKSPALALALLLIAALAIGGFVLVREEDPPPAPLPAPVAASSAPTSTPVVAPPPVLPTEPAPTTPATVTRVVRSQPDHAEVWRGEVSIGRTPYELTLGTEDSVELELRLPGHRSAQLTVGPDSPSELVVSLRARRSADDPTVPSLAPR